MKQLQAYRATISAVHKVCQPSYKFPNMKLNSLFAASVITLAATLSFAQTAPAVAPAAPVAPAVVQPAPAAAVDNMAKAQTPSKKHAKKQAHKVSVKKHKAAKHKKKAAM